MCQNKVKFCCPVKYVNIHIFSQLTWFSQTNCGWWRKTTYTFEFSCKSSIRITYFSSCAKKKVKFCWTVLSVAGGPFSGYPEVRRSGRQGNNWSSSVAEIKLQRRCQVSMTSRFSPCWAVTLDYTIRSFVHRVADCISQLQSVTSAATSLCLRAIGTVGNVDTTNKPTGRDDV